MKTLFTLLITLSFGLIYSQGIVSADYLGSITKEEIGDSIGLPVFQYGADYYKITYESKDAKGNPDTLSALLTVPTDVTENTYPLLVYEHGTANCKECVPSRFGQEGGDEGIAGLVFAGMGYVSLLPDYVGMGDGRGFQTYVYDTTGFTASIDLLLAFREWAPENDILLNDQLFITGYSQGGYVAMSFHKEMQSKYGAESVTAAAHNAGPYSLSGVMRDLILIDSSYAYPAYIPNTMLGMNEVHEIYPNLSDFYKAEFVDDIQGYYDGEIELTELNQMIIETLVANYGDTVAYRMIHDNIVDEVRNNPDHIINQLLEENDVHKWAPEVPTRLFYCKADDQVPYMNSVVAIDTMYARGADPDLVKAQDLNSDFDHTECIQPAFLTTLGFFADFQEITLGVEKQKQLLVNVYPNPTKDVLHINANLQGSTTILISDISGKLKMNYVSDSFNEMIDVSGLENGIYILQVSSENGVVTKKFVVER